MDFDFTEDQNMLRNLAREFLTEQSPVDKVRTVMAGEHGYDATTYKRFIQLGMLPIPEEYGGAGLGMIEQAILLEEMGRIPYPSPYFATVVLAASALLASGDDNAKSRYLPEICSGNFTMSLAFLEDALDWGPPALRAKLTPAGDGFTLSGQKRFVPFGHTADVILVAARTNDGRAADGVTLVAVPHDASGL